MGEKVKKPFYKRIWFIVLVVVLAIGFIGSLGDDKDDSGDDGNNKEEPTVSDKNDKNGNNITGELDVKIEGDKIVVTITTNAMDGSLFETSIMDSNFETVSDFLPVKDGKAVKEFDIPDKWATGYLAILSSMRFNLDDHPQPDDVKEAYGEFGEKLEGDLAVKNNLDGKNIMLEVDPIPYPDEETVLSMQNELFEDALKEVIELGDGVIVKIEPYLDNTWDSVKVTVSDAWYYSQEHEKERFAEQISNTISQIIMNTEQSKKDMIHVYFFDTYNKELASPKMFGGYKIKG